MKKFIIGVFSGLVTGLFASGGGVVLIPAFVYYVGMSEKEARATAVCCALVSTITSLIFYYKDRYFDIKTGVLVAIGGIIGACIGTRLLNKLPDRILKACFIIFLICVSIKFLM